MLSFNIESGHIIDVLVGIQLSYGEDLWKLHKLDMQNTLK
jgi:hypothetical protein